MSAPALKLYRVVVVEWHSHDAFIEAADAIAAEAEARRLWPSNSEHELFSFDYSDIESVHVEEA